MRTGQRPLRLLASFCLGALALTGCGTSGVRPQSRAEIEAVARSRGVEEVIIPFELNAEMREWVHAKVAKTLRAEQRLQTLIDELLSRDSLSIEYQKMATATAAEVFTHHQANCLSFTHLFVGMAREVGLPVYFLAVRDVENYERQGDLVVISDHIAVGHGPLHDLTIIDFSSEQGATYRRIQAISDLTATAMFYSNRGAEELRKGESDSAVRWLEQAVAIDPELAAAWVNLGVALRRAGNAQRAEAAYRRAMEIDPTTTSAFHNLATLLRLQGEKEEAIQLLALTDSARNRNPFIYLALGDLSMDRGRVDEAGRFYRRALRLYGNHAEPYAAMGLWELALGEEDRARRWLRKARKIDPEQARVALLAQRLDARAEG